MDFYQQRLSQECIDEVADALPPEGQEATRQALRHCLWLYARKLEHEFRRLYPMLADRVLGNGKGR